MTQGLLSTSINILIALKSLAVSNQEVTVSLAYVICDILSHFDNEQLSQFR